MTHRILYILAALVAACGTRSAPDTANDVEGRQDAELDVTDIALDVPVDEPDLRDIDSSSDTAPDTAVDVPLLDRTWLTCMGLLDCAVQNNQRSGPDPLNSDFCRIAVTPDTPAGDLMTCHGENGTCLSAAPLGLQELVDCFARRCRVEWAACEQEEAQVTVTNDCSDIVEPERVQDEQQEDCLRLTGRCLDPGFTCVAQRSDFDSSSEYGECRRRCVPGVCDDLCPSNEVCVAAADGLGVCILVDACPVGDSEPSLHGQPCSSARDCFPTAKCIGDLDSPTGNSCRQRCGAGCSDADQCPEGTECSLWNGMCWPVQ